MTAEKHTKAELEELARQSHVSVSKSDTKADIVEKLEHAPAAITEDGANVAARRKGVASIQPNVGKDPEEVRRETVKLLTQKRKAPRAAALPAGYRELNENPED